MCVFSSASEELDKFYYDTASELGKLLAQNNYDIVYGGGAIGPMFRAAKTGQENGCNVIGVLPEKLYQMGVGDGKCDKLIITKCTRSRKEKMDELSDAVITLAGGLGTLDELAEVIEQKHLGYSDKAIVILNTNGFYDNLLKFLDTMVEKKFAAPSASEIYFVAKTPQEAIEYLKSYVPRSTDLKQNLELKTK